MLYGEPVRFEKVENPTREQQQAAAELVFERVREIHGRLAQTAVAKRSRAARATRTSP